MLWEEITFRNTEILLLVFIPEEGEGVGIGYLFCVVLLPVFPAGVYRNILGYCARMRGAFPKSGLGCAVLVPLRADLALTVHSFGE